MVQESPGEGVRWSIIGLNGILYKDAGDYRCRAKNVAGNAEAYITLSVAGEGASTTVPPQITPRSPEGDAGRGSTTAVTGPTPLSPPSSSGTTSSTTTTTTTTTTLASTTPKRGLGPGAGIQRSPPAASRKGGKGASAEDDKNKKKPVDAKPGLKDIQVVEETVDSAVVVWTAEGMPGDAPVSILYTMTGEEDVEETRISTQAGRGKELLENLVPSQSYKVCLATKATAPGKEQCVEFSTLGDGESPVLVIASAIACVLAVPLILLLTYKIVCLYCRGSSGRGGDDGDSQEDLSKESYVKFETLTMKQRTLNGHVPTHDLWSRRHTESERMLLCSRSSIDSQMTYKSDSSRSEYLC